MKRWVSRGSAGLMTKRDLLTTGRSIKYQNWRQPTAKESGFVNRSAWKREGSPRSSTAHLSVHSWAHVETDHKLSSAIFGGIDSHILPFIGLHTSEPHFGESLEKVEAEIEGWTDFRVGHAIELFGRQWLDMGKPELAVLLEEGMTRQIDKAGDLLCEVLLSDHSTDAVAAVAAQRVRMLPLKDEVEIRRLWVALRRRVEEWMSPQGNEDFAVRAIPSVAYVAGNEAGPWLAKVIETRRPRLAWAAALGVLDWACHMNVSDVSKRKTELITVTKEILKRLAREGKRPVKNEARADLTATLIWALGATVTSETLPQASKVLAGAYKKGQNLEDAAALRAARLLFRRLGSEAVLSITEAFGGVKDRHLSELLSALA